jgi:ABC-type transport system involved in multi-copper enzyme maturation permease subunit
MISERISLSKLIQLGIQLLIIPVLLFMILSSPIVEMRERKSRVLDRELKLPDKPQTSFEAFMTPEGEEPPLTPGEIMLQRKKDAEDQFASEVPLEPQRLKSGVFFLLSYSFYLLVGVPLICVILAGGVSRDEIRNDTLPYFLCRPLRRMSYMTIRLITQIIWLEIILGIQLLLLFACGILAGTPWITETFAYAALAQVLSIPVWCAIGIFMGLINKNYLIFSIVYGLIVEVGIASLPSNIKMISMMAHIKSILGQAPLTLALRPNWEIPTSLVPAIPPLVLGFVFFMILSAVTFHFKELLPSHEAEK